MASQLMRGIELLRLCNKLDRGVWRQDSVCQSVVRKLEQMLRPATERAPHSRLSQNSVVFWVRPDVFTALGMSCTLEEVRRRFGRTYCLYHSRLTQNSVAFCVRLDVFTALGMSCTLEEVRRRFGGTYCLHPQCRGYAKQTTSNLNMETLRCARTLYWRVSYESESQQRSLPKRVTGFAFVMEMQCISCEVGISRDMRWVWHVARMGQKFIQSTGRKTWRK
jgi:hypothetical protein